ncbi:MAG: DUF3455 domain-containing protein [Cyanobacteria bacterium REEB67]|nr:DUF3455 domain-containing protein [Cyanobacteria bacterium REEB67]
MSKTRQTVIKTSVLACLCVIFFTPALPAWSDESSTNASRIPLGANKKLLFKTTATGVKIYRYRQGQKSQKPSWSLVTQEATVLDAKGKKIGRYFDGATWKFDDGAIVVGKMPPQSDEKGIERPYWLIFDVTEAIGPRVKDVRYVKSIETTSGLVPAEGYKDDKIGDEQRVPYRAEYWFYTDWSK